MAENSKIEWCDHTFNPWVGCTKISPACDHCYAESWAKRTGQAALWTGERRRTGDANWRQPLKWDRDAMQAGVRRKVLCASLADVFDNQVPDEWRRDLWAWIKATPHLDWLLLTKRPQNITRMLPKSWEEGWSNVWLGTTAENQAEADRRIPHLLRVPARVRFLSCEPLLEAVSFRWAKWLDCRAVIERDGRVGHLDGLRGIHWVICGGESGHGARLMNPDWARSMRDQCDEAAVPFFMKQMTKKTPIPDDLMVREFPT